MRQDVYQAMAKVEDAHWWFRGRRAIITAILRTLKLNPNAAILDAGSGTGGNLAMLSAFGKVQAIEMDAEARALANVRGIVKVEDGELPDKIPFGDQSFDLIAMFDVLEHIERDFDTLITVHTRLTQEGKLLLTVPAFEFLWSMHDVVHHHKRRYGLSSLIRLLERAGFRVTFASYINFWLFPSIAFLRIVDRITAGRVIGKKQDTNAELSIRSVRINRLLEKVFASEAALIRFMRLPFGVSILLVAQKV